MDITLPRIAYIPKVACMGYLIAGDLKLATLEEAWAPDPDGPGGQRREGALIESCVSDGTYQLLPHTSDRFPNVWRLFNPQLGVYNWPGDIPNGQPWGRSAILIHAGNTTSDIMGCIAVGMRHSWEWSAQHGARPRVDESRKALDLLRQVLGSGAHRLTIRPTAGTLELV